MWQIIIFWGLAIAALVVGSEDYNCNNVDDGTNMTITDYLIFYGIVNFIYYGAILLLILMQCIMVCSSTNNVKSHGKLNTSDDDSGVILCVMGGYLFLIIMLILNFVVFVMGAVIIFRSNIDCIKQGAGHVIFALVIWGISALQFLYELLKEDDKDKKKKSTDSSNV